MRSSSEDVVAIAMYNFDVDKTLHPKGCMSRTGRYVCELLSRKMYESKCMRQFSRRLAGLKRTANEILGTLRKIIQSIAKGFCLWLKNVSIELQAALVTLQGFWTNSSLIK